MTRWSPDAKGRLVKSAMELFARRGYDQTTVAEIAERAGLTERTFFRYFADKKEVLFGANELRDLLAAAVASAPSSRSPMEAVADGLVAAGKVFTEERRDYSRRRQSIIAGNEELRERELIKLASIASAITQALRRRGVPEPSASLSAEAGIAVFHVAFQRWVDAGSRAGWSELVRSSLAELKILVAS